MILLLEISFASGTEYLTNKDQAVVYGSNQYLPLVESVSSFQENQNPEGGYEVSPITVVLKDADSKFRNIIRTDIYIQGVQVIIRDESGTLLYTTKIQSWQPGPLNYTLTLNHMIDFESEICDLITAAAFPNAVQNALNQPIPKPYNSTTVKCWKVSVTEHTSNYHFLIGKGIATISNLCIGSLSNAAAASYTLTNDGTYDYVKILPGCYFVMGDYCYVDVTTDTDYEPIDIISDLLDGKLTVATNAAFAAYLAAEGYDHDTVSYCCQEKISVQEVLRQFCTSFNCNYRIDSSGELIFTYIDPDSLSITEFQPAELQDFSCTQPFDTLSVLTYINYGYLYEPQAGKFTETVYSGAKLANWGKRESELQGFYFLNEAVQAAKSGEKIYTLNQDPPSAFTAKLTTSKAASLYPGSLVRMQDSEPLQLHTPNPICLYVLRKETNHDDDTATLEMKSVDFLSPTDYWIGNNGIQVIANDYPVIVSREV